MSGIKNTASRLALSLLRLGVVLIVIVALYVTAGRQLAPLLAGQKEWLEDRLSQLTGAQVSIDSLQGSWWHFNPQVHLQGVQIRLPAGQAPGFHSHQLEQLAVQLDVPGSLLHGQWRLGQVSLNRLHLKLKQAPSGRWSLAGFPVPDENRLPELLDFMLRIGDLQVKEVSLALHPVDGDPVSLQAEMLHMTQRAGQLELRLQAQLQETGPPAQLQLRALGETDQAFRGSVYLELQQTDLSSLAGLLEATGLQVRQLAGGLRLWAGFDRSGLRTLQGEIVQGHVAGPTVPDVSEISATFGARRNPARDWQLWLEDPAFHWQDRAWQPGPLFARLRAEQTPAGITLLSPGLDLALLRDWVLLGGLLPEAARTVLATLDPVGQLRNVRLQARLDGQVPRDVSLRANLDQVSVQAWSGAPAARGVSGYLQADRHGGFVELDTDELALHLPKLFPQPWHYDRVQGRVSWSLVPGQLRVASNVMQAQNENIDGNVQFGLYSRKNPGGGWVSDLDLKVGVREMNAAIKSAYLPVLPRLSDTMEWLDQAIEEGRLVNSGFIFRGPVGRNVLPGSRTTQSFYHFTDASLKYLAQWPRLEGGSGYVRVDDEAVDIRASSALVSGIKLDTVLASLRKNAQEPGFWLEIAGDAQTSTQLGLDFLRNSPTRQDVDGFLQNWEASGMIGVELQLGIPLGMAQSQPEIRVNVRSDNSQLHIPDYGLQFEQVRGRVEYSSARGLSAQGLTAELFGFPIEVGMETFDTAVAGSMIRESGTRIFSTGKASQQALQAWSQQWGQLSQLLDSASGTIDYTAELRIYNSPNALGGLTRLVLESGLQGLTMDLPAPFGKDLEQTRPLHLQLDFVPGRLMLTSRFDNKFYGQLHFLAGQVERGMLNFGEQNRDFMVRQSDASAPGVLITGQLEQLDLDAWNNVLQRLDSGESGVESGTARLGSRVPLQVDMHISRLRVGGQTLSNINTVLNREARAWQVFLENEAVRGSFMVPDDNALPLRVDLDYLRLPGKRAGQGGGNGEDSLAELDPAGLPALEFEAEEFSLGDKHLGSWRFSLEPKAQGARISGLKVAMPGAGIDALDGDQGAELEWHRVDGEHHSTFTGRFWADDLSVVLPALGYDANVVSESAALQGELDWAGSPAAFSLPKVHGGVTLLITDGRFADIDSASSRLFGAFSFDSIVRRLQLDFSDLYQRGFAFDSISGALRFNGGTVKTDSKVLIEGPSSKITIDGEMDLLEQTVQADMLVNVPLSQNISVLAGILGAWPLAVSTYVAGRLFEEQMEDFSSVLYRLEGPWDQLQAGFQAPNRPADSQPPRR